MKYINVETKNLTGAALAYAVACCDGWSDLQSFYKDDNIDEYFFQQHDGYCGFMSVQMAMDKTQDWEYVGRLIESSCISISPCPKHFWTARSYGDASEYVGDTALLAFLRCYAANYFGTDVPIPSVLLEEQ